MHVTVKWAVSVINKLRLRPPLVITPRIPPLAHRRRSGSSWRVDTNYRRQGICAGDFSIDQKTQFLFTQPPFGALVEGGPIGSSPRPLASENWSPLTVVWLYLRDPTFSRFRGTLTI